jgi:hypothetical protein
VGSEKQIQIIGVKFQDNPDSVTEEELQNWKSHKDELEACRSEKLKGNILRAKVNWLDSGEKPSNYFLNLENQNYTSKLIPKIITDSGQEIVDQTQILDEQRKFYKGLYSEKDTLTREEIRTELKDLPHPKLNEDTASSLEGDITIKELSVALKSMKNGKSPGIDGFTTEFFKIFWQYIGQVLLRAINESYADGTLSVSLHVYQNQVKVDFI